MSRRAARRAWCPRRGRPGPARTAGAALRSGDASATIPAVAATDSWNPMDQTSHGSRITSTRTAAARIEPVARGLPISTPTSAIVAITPARITDGSAPVITTKNATVPTPRPNRGHRVSRSSEASPRIGASTIATFSPDTTSRWPSPLAWKSRIMPASSWDASPNASPRSSPASRAGNSRAIDRPTNARNTCAARMNGLGRRPQALDGVAVQLDDHALVGERIAEAGIVGPADHALGSDDVSAHPAARVVLGAQPQGSAQRRGAARPLDPRDVERGVPSERAGARDRCGAHRSPSRGGARAEPAANRRATTRGRPPIRRRRARDRPAPARPRSSGDRRPSLGAATAATGASSRSASPASCQRVRVRRHAWSREPRADDARRAPAPSPSTDGAHGGWTSHASSPAQNAAAAAGSAHAFIPWRRVGSVRGSRVRSRSRRSGRPRWRKGRSACGSR